MPLFIRLLWTCSSNIIAFIDRISHTKLQKKGRRHYFLWFFSTLFYHCKDISLCIYCPHVGIVTVSYKRKDIAWVVEGYAIHRVPYIRFTSFTGRHKSFSREKLIWNRHIYIIRYTFCLRSDFGVKRELVNIIYHI